MLNDAPTVSTTLLDNAQVQVAEPEAVPSDHVIHDDDDQQDKPHRGDAVLLSGKVDTATGNVKGSLMTIVVQPDNSI